MVKLLMCLFSAEVSQVLVVLYFSSYIYILKTYIEDSFQQNILVSQATCGV